MLAVMAQAGSCLRSTSGADIPFGFLGGGRKGSESERVPRESLVAITSYQFQCCGNITAWQTYVHPEGARHRDGVYGITLYVLRPGSGVEEDGCYSIVGEDRYEDIQLLEEARGLVNRTLEPANFLAVQPGDVVGYYVTVKPEEGGPPRPPNEGITLMKGGNETVWYFTNTPQNPLMFASSPCQFTVGNGRTLSSFTNSTPVLNVVMGKSHFKLSYCTKLSFLFSKIASQECQEVSETTSPETTPPSTPPISTRETTLKATPPSTPPVTTQKVTSEATSSAQTLTTETADIQQITPPETTLPANTTIPQTTNHPPQSTNSGQISKTTTLTATTNTGISGSQNTTIIGTAVGVSMAVIVIVTLFALILCVALVRIKSKKTADTANAENTYTNERRTIQKKETDDLYSNIPVETSGSYYATTTHHLYATVEGDLNHLHKIEDMELTQNQAYARTLTNIPVETNECYGFTTPLEDPDPLYATVDSPTTQQPGSEEYEYVDYVISNL